MAYGTTAGVSALVPAVGVLGASSLPTAAQVTTWLAQGAAAIDRVLGGAGYVAPVSPSAAVYPELTALNELYAAAYVVMARGLDSATGENESRSGEWLDRFYKRLGELAAADLSALGVSTAGASAAAVAAYDNRLRTRPLRRLDGWAAASEGLDG